MSLSVQAELEESEQEERGGGGEEGGRMKWQEMQRMMTSRNASDFCRSENVF